VYPEGWFVVAGLQDITKRNLMPPEIQTWLENPPIDFSKTRVLIVRAGHDEFQENLNVCVIDKQPPINDNTLKVLLRLTRQRYMSLGGKLVPAPIAQGFHVNRVLITGVIAGPPQAVEQHPIPLLLER